MIRLVVSVLFVALLGCAGPRQLSSSGAGAYEASLTIGVGRSAVAWYDTRGGNAEIYAREIDENGRGVGPEHRLTSGSADSYEADIVSVSDAFAVAWYEQTSSGERRAKLGLWNSSFEPLWIVDLSPADRDSRIPVVETFGNRIFCAWIETNASSEVGVRAGWWDMEGRVVIEPRLLGAAGPTTWNLNSAIDAEGSAYVVFDAKVGTRSEELFLARVGDTGIELERLTADDGIASKYPDLALAAEGAALTWLDQRDGNVDVYLLVGPSSDLADDIDALALQVTKSTGESIGADVAWNDGRVGLAWSDDSVGQYEIYFQSFDSTGLAINDPARLTHNRTASFIPSIQASADTFMLSWNEVALDGRGELASDARSEIPMRISRRGCPRVGQ